MPTLARLDQVELLQHVIVKAVPGQRLFEDDNDRDIFLRIRDPLLARTETQCLAWVLLPDHFHLHPGKAVAAELGVAHSTICAGALAGEALLHSDYRLYRLRR
ncbi:hypothetical protein L4X63_12320 [Geomonas sp. Red32]|uniref:hypothetical protein n=1 Tax=Geomonas sp. Red32 TaxID=2912856 RepID=UPI00202CCF23|nr:hypothetical protein [Geomonas sp. Red32]MCM0082374.1 hypothetical protein [Geomonas sp. Red32]